MVNKIQKEELLSLIYVSVGKVSFSSFGDISPQELVKKAKEINYEEIDVEYAISFIESFKVKAKDKNKENKKNEALTLIINNLKTFN